MTERFGFHNRKDEGRKPSNLESELGLFLDSEKTPPVIEGMEEYFLNIMIDDMSVFGVYRGTTKDGVHVLMSSITPIDDKSYAWVNAPARYAGSIRAARYVLEPFLNSVAQDFDKVRGLGKVYNKKNKIKK